MAPRSIRPLDRPLDVAVRVPGSKSVTHRALVLAALADGTSILEAPLDADDTRATAEGLCTLGVGMEFGAGAWTVHGVGGAIPGGGVIDLAQSGSSMRFLAAVAALGRRPTDLDGHPRLRERPMDGLYGPLRAIGGHVTSPGAGRALPARIGGTAVRGGRVVVSCARSSQFLSALLLVGARLPDGIDARVCGPSVSMPYVDVTCSTLRAFGVDVQVEGTTRYVVAPGAYAGRTLPIEGDHSSASCLLAAAAVIGGRVRVDGIRADSGQPDARFAALLEKLGCAVEIGETFVDVRGRDGLDGFDVNLVDAPDLAPAVALLALFARGPSRIRGIAHLHRKESDRPAVLAENLRALGRSARVADGELHVEPSVPGGLRGAAVRTAGDHRIAMAFAVAGLKLEGVVLDDPACVAKSFPGFWEAFATLEGAR